MKKSITLLLGALLAFAGLAAPITGKHTFEVGEDSFLLDSKPFVIRCGEMHFARVPRAYWRHRIQMVKAAGFNAVCAYMFWNNHEPVRGRYEFDGEKDVKEFCRIAQEEGMWVVLRPGPYTCAEWEFGGLPWWLLKEDGIQLRTSDPRYLKPACEYLYEVAKLLKDSQVTHGGNILMVQVENEYGFWGNDKEYMKNMYDAVRRAGFDIPAFCCNPAYNLPNGLIPELLPVVNFGSNPQNAFTKLREVRAKGPLMCGEYYPAWFDSWGEGHHTKGSAQCLADLEYMLKTNASFSVYMAHGGTSFAWWAGCNAAFRPQTSSYDYDAPVSESGRPHPTKFNDMKNLFARYLNEGETIPEMPALNPVQSAVVAATPEVADMWKVGGEPIASEKPLTFEKAGFGYGYAIYRTTIPAGKGGELKADCRDLGVVRVNGREIGYFDRRYPKLGVRVESAAKARTLEILVEEMARYNFGKIMHESMKGLIGDVTLAGEPLTGWQMKKIDLNGDGMKLMPAFGTTPAESEKSGRLLRYTVKLDAKDTFLDMHDFRRGMVRVNGRWIGRYWSIGPTQTMYVPGCWLKNGANEIVVIDAVGGFAAPAELRFLDKPVLAEMRPESDYYAIQARPKLAKPLANPALEGEFSNDITLQRVKLPKPLKGRYFALESVDAWDGQPFAACGEIDLDDAAGNNIPHSKWSIAAVDSEERKGEDGSADNLIDGQTANLWHSEWQSKKPGHPHYFVIDLGKEETVGGFRFTPRQSNGGGRIRHYRVYVLDAVEVTGASAAKTAAAADAPALVPFPKEFTSKKGSVTLASLAEAKVKMLPKGKLPPEGYAIRIAKDKGVSIAASDEDGVFYAKETLRQLGKKTEKGWRFPCCEIKDFPEFKWRGILFDDCRHFFGKAAVLKTLRAMAAHKMNVFHWHLTEDQAWRLDIPKYPELVKYGAYRSQSQYPDGLGKGNALDGKPYGPFFYTADDVKEILAEAKKLHIRVIPEIELPGHAVAAVAAYPELCCRGKAVFDGKDHGEPWPRWGVSKDVFCPGNDKTIKFLEDVLDYVCELFPDEVVHIGGDECPKDMWRNCAKCKKRATELGVGDVRNLQGWMTKHFTEYLAKKGKRTIGWDEITECDIPKNTMVMNWHGSGAKAALKGQEVVMCPTKHCYLDYPQGADHAAKGYGYPTWSIRLPLERVYALDPYEGIADEEARRNIVGVQGNMWAESIVTPEEHEWKLWPRAAALAEIGWTGAGKRDFADFKRRVDVDMGRMAAAGYNVCK